MKKKLFLYMLVLLLIILCLVGAVLFLTGKLSDSGKSMTRDLNMQMALFEREMTARSDTLVSTDIRLSSDISQITEKYLDDRNISFSDLRNSPARVEELQRRSFEALYQSLLQAGCSGAFIIYDTTVNDDVPNARYSRSGIYLTSDGATSNSSNITMFRGSVAVAKENGIQPHRKWQMEFSSNRFIEYNRQLREYGGDIPAENQYIYSKPVTLPGTSEKVVILSIPVIGEGGQIYGICGFEVSESFFKQEMAQTSAFDHLISVTGVREDDSLMSQHCFSCGTTGGYYIHPGSRPYRMTERSDGLTVFDNGTDEYIGICNDITLSPNNGDTVIGTMIPKNDYDRAISIEKAQILLIILLIGTASVVCCVYFSRRFIGPVMEALNEIKTQTPSDSRTNITEIDDLLTYLREQEDIYNERYEELLKEQQSAIEKANLIQLEIDQLTEKRKNSIDPDIYEMFTSGIPTLTPKEREIYDLYAEGYKSNDVTEKLSISKNTLKYHNRNIYSKLGVRSRKELLQYNVIMQYADRENE